MNTIEGRSLDNKKIGKVVIITGQSGVSKKPYLDQVIKQTYISQEKRKEIELFDIGDLMYKEAEKAGGKIQPGRILNLSLLRLTGMRRSVFKDVIHYHEKYPQKNILINTHSCFRWQYGLFSAFDFDLIQKLNPDVYVTLIDNVDAIFLRLKQNEEPDVKEYSLKDILVWREEEMITTEMIASAQRKPFYIIPRNNPIDTIYKLIFHDHLKKTYLSFPITKVRDKPDVIKEIDDFKKKMAELLIIFDPITITEKRLLLINEEDIKTGSISIETLGKEVEFKVSEVKSIANDIDGQIILRDFRLIDQSDMIIAFIPEVDNRPDISAGVQTEMHYAHDLPREVYVIWESKSEPSVWVEQMATKVFRGEKAFEDCISYFRNVRYI